MDDAFATIARNALKNETEEELYIPGAQQLKYYCSMQALMRAGTSRTQAEGWPSIACLLHVSLWQAAP